MASVTMVIFAKAPVPGFVKTRLATAVGPDVALAFYVQTLVTLVERLRGDMRWTLEIAVTPDDAVGSDMLWPAGIARRPQGDGDIGHRMARVLSGARPGQPVVIVGSDIPDLQALHVARACAALERHDLVFGPARDGGFWLIGARRPLPRGFFYGVRWSSEHALTDSLLRARGLAVTLVDTLEDVDDHASYRRYVERAELSVQPDEPGR